MGDWADEQFDRELDHTVRLIEAARERLRRKIKAGRLAAKFAKKPTPSGKERK